jgi:predicted ATP-dependent endonuclease of OLD family
MSRIVELKIVSFRGIKDLALSFPIDRNLFCFIGRGDSGKSTILEAISLVLSPRWAIKLIDSDFHNCNPEEPILIEATLVDLPDSFLIDSQFGLLIRGYNPNTGHIVDDINDEVENEENLLPSLTIRLSVGKYLEPKWSIVNGRSDKEVTISANERAKLSCFFIADYIDSHFSWNKGNPLFSVLKSLGVDSINENTDTFTDSIRDIKNKFDSNDFIHLDEASLKITREAQRLGLDISEIKSSIDLKEMLHKENKITLHDKNIPFRQRGKGTKRLASIAIQSVLVNEGGIMLIDEIEQGLEPDRAKTLARYLNEELTGQVFITTHSRDVLTEIGSQPIHHLIKDIDTGELTLTNLDKNKEDLQKAIRACPEAFFAEKTIICEGATEVGICRAIDTYIYSSKNSRMSSHNTAYIDGGGSTLISRTKEIAECMKTILFCDSDVDSVNKEKQNLNETLILDCEDDLSLEQQIFKDAPWNAVLGILEYAFVNNEDSFKEKLKEQLKIEPNLTSWKDSTTLRTEIIKIFESKKGTVKTDWFKAVHHGELIGNYLTKYISDFDEKCRLFKNISNMVDWVCES